MPPMPASFGFRGAFRIDLPRACRVQRGGGDRADPAARGRRAARRRRRVAIVRWAAETNAPLVPRGSGSSMAGGAIGDGVIVDLSRLDADRTRRTSHRAPSVAGRARCATRWIARRAPSGCSSPSIRRAARSARSAGWPRRTRRARTRCATARRACGSRRSTASSPTARAPSCDAERRPPQLPLVARALDALAPVIAEERASPSRHVGVRKESSGYGLAAFADSGDLVDLMVGSEGTLALVVGLELRLAPLRPHTASVLGAFATLEGAVVGADGARRMGAVACEALDRTFLDVARRGGAPCRRRRTPSPCCSPRSRRTRRRRRRRWCERSRRSSAPPARRRSRWRSTPPRSMRCGRSVTRRARS